MTDTYLVNNQQLERAADSESSALSTTLGAMLIICLPTAFWMGIIEIANLLVGLGLDTTTRLSIAGTLVGVLLIVWCFVTVSARQMRHQEQASDLGGLAGEGRGYQPRAPQGSRIKIAPDDPPSGASIRRGLSSSCRPRGGRRAGARHDPDTSVT